ncbi:MAG TPA: hypothetical protein VFL95_04170 [Gemmatimonadales bacterium]|jgi:hypothetical protein|nr:hypothetical protein [Gemmatimonadales bacterium]
MDTVVSSSQSLTRAADRLGAFFADQPTRQGILARSALGRPTAYDDALRERLIAELRGETRLDGSVGGSVLPTIWRAHELMDLGHRGDQAGSIRVMGWVLSLQGKPGAFGEGCADSRHQHRVCEHYMSGFFSAAPPTQRLAPVTLPNGKPFRAEAAARFALSCLALRAALRSGHEGRPLVEQHLVSLGRLAEGFEDWGGYFAPDMVASALYGLALAGPQHRPAVERITAVLLANQNDDGTWHNADLFHTLEALITVGSADAREAVRRAAPALMARQRADGTFGGAAQQERALIGLRALLIAADEA